MQVHVHLGYDTRIGKTLSVILTFALTYPDQRVLILDMDNYGFKVHALLAPLADRIINAVSPKNGNTYSLYHVRDTQTYIASWPDPGSPNIYFDEMTQAVEIITSAVQDDLTQGDDSTRFEGFQHVVVDTSESVLSFRRLERALTLPKETTHLKFWINHDALMYTEETTPELFWQAYTRIKQFNPKHTNIGDGNFSFIYVFNPAGFFTRTGLATANQKPILGFWGSPPYRELVEQDSDQNLWVSPMVIVANSNPKQRIPTFDIELKRILAEYEDTRGREVARWWNAQYSTKPLNVVFIPVDTTLEEYRNRWATKPLTGLRDLRVRLGDVLTSASLREQWKKLINIR